MTCGIDGCGKTGPYTKGLCKMHYERRRRGSQLAAHPTRPTILEVFESRYMPEPMSGCWIWIGGANSHPDGDYGAFNNMGAHRFSYATYVGPIPEGLELDHLCRNRLCVNPKHLEPVTHLVNCRRGARGDLRPRKTQCVNGHELTEANTYVFHSPDRGGRIVRHCRKCNRIACRKRDARRKNGAASFPVSL